MLGERYRNLSEKEKNKKYQYGRKQYKNLPENEKLRLVEYRKNSYRMHKNKDRQGFS